MKRIRQFTGMRDPDATDEDMSPEDVQKAQAAQQEMMMRDAQATIAKKEADAKKSLAQAGEIQARTTMTNVGAQKTALEAAGTAAAVPSLADIADHILHESGFASRTEAEQTMKALAEQAAAEQQAAAAQPPGQPAHQMAIGLG